MRASTIACSLVIGGCLFGHMIAGKSAFAETKKKGQPPANDVSKLKPPKGPQRGPAKSGPPVVMLTTRDPQLPQRFVDFSTLFREILRESFLLAAREELGLPTRDKTVREPFPNDAEGKSARAPIELLARVDETYGAKITVFVRDGDKYRVLWDRVVKIPAERLADTLVTRAEELSRKEFPAVLKAEGYKGRSNSFRKSAPVSDEVKKLLTQWSFLPQYAAIRRLHAEIRKNGESPELLAALSRGYANLSTLAEFHWSPAHKVYKARALLYAERLIAKSKQSPLAYWARGYARGVIGRHAPALDDFRTAEAVAKLAPGTKAPAWLPIVKAYCSSDFEALNAAAEKGEHQSAARYLHMLGVEFTNSQNVRLKAAGRVLETNPDCYRAVDMICAVPSLGAKREGAMTGFRYLSKTLYDRISTVHDLSGDVRKLIAAHQAAGADPIDEIATRMKLVGLLRKEGLQDRSEPSLAVLAQLIQEVSFVHAYRLLTYQKNSLAVNADNTLSMVEPLAKGHPYAGWLQSFASNRGHVIAALKKLAGSIDLTEMELTESVMFNRVYYMVGAKAFRPLMIFAMVHSDYLCRDLQRMVAQASSMQARMESLKALQKVSPEHPVTIAYTIRYDWKSAAPKAAEWEKKYRNDTGVLMLLADKYLQLKRNADCERIMKRHVEVARGKQAYTKLANFYYSLKKYDQWKQTLDEFLTLPSLGLEHAQVRVSIARHYMRRQEWQTAQPYADAAAQTGAAWAMLRASECHEGLGNLQRSESYVRATSQRYRAQSSKWYFWCRRTGSGDGKSAANYARAYFRGLGNSMSPSQLKQLGFFLTMENETDKAQQVFRQNYQKTADPNYRMQTLLLTQSNGDDKLLMELLKSATENLSKWKSAEQPKKAFKQLFGEFRKCLSQGNAGKLDLAAVDKIILQAPANYPTEFWSFVGRFLLHRGDKKNAEKYLKLSATSPNFNYYNSMLAAIELRKQRIAIGPRRTTELPTPKGAKKSKAATKKK